VIEPDNPRPGANDVIERFERFRFGKGVKLGSGVDPLLERRQRVGRADEDDARRHSVLSV
jgi:hypothetical protein